MQAKAKSIFDLGDKNPPHREKDDWDRVKNLARCLKLVESYAQGKNILSSPIEDVFQSEFNEESCRSENSNHIWTDKFKWKSDDGSWQEVTMTQVDSCGASSAEYFAERSFSPASATNDVKKRTEALEKVKTEIKSLYQSFDITFAGKTEDEMRATIADLNKNFFLGQNCVSFDMYLEQEVKEDLVPAITSAGTKACKAEKKLVPDRRCHVDAPYNYDETVAP